MTKNISIPALTRVEGEGALYIKTKDKKIVEIELNIYEPPRFYEGFLQGRYFQEVPDITARICGICPVAYQMSGAQALENAYGVEISQEVYDLRRLLYCAEYIESHVLHMYMLQAPDLLGTPSVIEIAAIAPEVVKKALRSKKLGNDLLKAIGGRSVHPVNTKVGGFYRWPDKHKIKDLIEDFKWGLEFALETVRWAATLNFPDFEMAYEYVAITHPDHYAIYDGDVLSSTGIKVPVEEYETRFLESHVPQSTALHSHTTDGNSYFVGPLARYNLNFEQLRPAAKEVAKEIGFTPPQYNPYKGMLARAVETVEVYDVALELMEKYDPKGPAHVKFELKDGEGYGVSEAPRGLLYHRYKVGQDGLIKEAKITPPTAQNYAQMERDLAKLAPEVLFDRTHEEASLALEHLLRSYDPCISCSTHFLKLKHDRA
ncbi:MAG: Ni/Fe hydrogenase subunit alpha [Anaerolineales bacterium]|nr:Ni/Fe hydrogenase subunit alpha [Anaerolineales bacterium]